MSSTQWVVFFVSMLAATVQLYMPLVLGIPFDLPPWAIGVATLIGGSVGVIVFLSLGDRLRPWIDRQLTKNEKRKKTALRIQGLGDRHGTFGVGFIAPFLIGLLLSAAVGITLDLPRRRLGFYLILVVLIWAVGLWLAAGLIQHGLISPPPEVPATTTT